MKVCIVGAGAIGGLVATRLAVAGRAQVSAIARGATLDALSEHGWRLSDPRGASGAPARVTSDPRDLGEQDLVILAIKAPALRGAATGIAPLIGPQTVVMPAMNGVPWWFVAKIPAMAGAPLQSIDPGGEISRAIPLHHVIGCVVHLAATTTHPGVVRHVMGNRLIIGEPAGGRSDRVTRIAQLLEDAGFEVVQSNDIRRDIWYKLWGNMTMNPVTAITDATADRVLADPLVREFNSAVMREAAAIGARIGCPIEETPEDRHQVTARLGAFRTSMLQDVEAGRPIELDALLGAVVELGQRVGVPAPCTEALFGLARLFGRVHGLYPEAP
ncbi:MAG TPA: 2-dehydropantoate 2-reductase [Usitatibacter sp.]|nr:2-dehydropantoate 2-reductase [Usitatibacter sp.]